MNVTGSIRSLYLATEPDPAFAIFHSAAAGAAPGAAVLICPPWGWDEVASYRSRREWAQRLAAAGHPTLRLTLPATGESAGSPHDPGRVAAWVAAIDGAARWLRARDEAKSLAVLGLGLGGLLARAAAAAGAPIDELVLWGAPASGRAFARETRAFSRLQAWHDDDDDANSSLPEGWIEAGGFVLSAETLESLRALGPEIASGPSLRRALLLDRDGVAVDPALQAGLEGDGVEVEVATGEGWADLVSDVERTRLSATIAERVAEWLGRSSAASGSGPSGESAPAELKAMTLEVDGHRLRERPLRIERPFGQMVGMLAEPVGESASELCAVFLNAGAVRGIGPNRLWLETARRWAAGGVRTLRLDLEGIGEADGEAPASIPEFYRSRYGDQIEAALDWLQSEGFGARFLLVGLCAGGYWAFQTALNDPRVEAAVPLNAGALVWEDDLIVQRDAGRLTRARHRRPWGKLARGEIGFRAMLSALGSAAVVLRIALTKLLRGRRVSLRAEVESELARLGDSGAELTLGLSDREPLLEELQLYGVLDRLDRWPGLSFAALPGADHTLRPIPAQVGARTLLDDCLERAITRQRGDRQEQRVL